MPTTASSARRIAAADPKVKERIKQLVDRAEGLEEQQLKANPNDVDALYARGVTRAQFALYTALVERAWFSALRNAVGARHDHERVLELNPNYVDAKLVVGTHNYVMGSLPWSVKVAVALVGLSGTKEKGFEYLREVADSNGENSVDAKVVLSLFLRREHRYDEARGLMHDLAARYPRNYLFPLEEANLLRASGHLAGGRGGYRKVWQNGREGKYGNLHYEMAAWGLGELLRSQKDYAGAAAAYEMVSEAPRPDPETLQKANLAAGEMYDLLQKRDLAMKKYQTVLAENGSTPPAEKAREHIREATGSRAVPQSLEPADALELSVYNCVLSCRGLGGQSYVLQLLRQSDSGRRGGLCLLRHPRGSVGSPQAAGAASAGTQDRGRLPRFRRVL